MINRYNRLDSKDLFNLLIAIKIWAIVSYIILYIFITQIGYFADVPSLIFQLFQVYIFMYFYFKRRIEFIKYIWFIYVILGVLVFAASYILPYMSENILFMFTAVKIDSYFFLVVVPNLIIQILTVDKLFRNKSEESTE
jgi:hypothetical protein